MAKKEKNLPDVNFPKVFFPDLVAYELDKARDKHPGGMNSFHEAYGVILEEMDEFWDEVKTQKPQPEKILEELSHIAAMCQRAAEDLLKCNKTRK